MTPKPTKAIAFLRSHEWSSGNGQCPICAGLSISFFEHKIKLYGMAEPEPQNKLEECGHMKNCPLAVALEELGETVLRCDEAVEIKEHRGLWTP